MSIQFEDRVAAASVSCHCFGCLGASPAFPKKEFEMHYSREPDQIFDVDIDGHNVAVYSYGTSDNVLLALSGGPGVACDYLREPLVRVVENGVRLVIYDQLGTGRSGRPVDASFWTIERCAREVEAVRTALDLKRVNLLGHSWGGMLAIEYATMYGENLNSLILDETFADVPFQRSESCRIRAALGPEIVAMMQMHEAEGTFDHPEYQAACTLLDYQHVCRLKHWPEPLLRSYSEWNDQMKLTLLGSRTFVFDGNLRDWSRLDRLSSVTAPVLINAGMHDEITPVSSRMMAERFPNAICNIFRNASHTPFYECPDEYFSVLLAFLEKHSSSLSGLACSVQAY